MSVPPVPSPPPKRFCGYLESIKTLSAKLSPCVRLRGVWVAVPYLPPVFTSSTISPDHIKDHTEWSRRPYVFSARLTLHHLATFPPKRFAKLLMAEYWSQFVSFGYALTLRDVLDVALVAFLIYELLRLVHGTRAVQMSVGLGLVALLYQLSIWMGLTTVQWLLRNAVLYLGFAVIVLFQHEIRSALMQLGKNIRLPMLRTRKRLNTFGDEWYDDVVMAANTLSTEKIGALMVFERDIGLRNLIEGGIKIDAQLTYDLLVTIFNTHTPLHDGAVIVSNGRIAAASCFLPLTQNPQVSRELGTRHRSGIGVTEDTDAFAVIVSEETGAISFVVEGRLLRNLDGPRLRRLIQSAMEPWRTEAETEAQEEEERARQRELDEIIASTKASRRQAIAEE
jgi:diadenylate cyclase